MAEASVIGLDLAKNVFQVHGIDASGQVVLRRKLRRAEMAGFFANLTPALIGVEACGTAHHWVRLLGEQGHTVRLMPPTYGKPYVKRGKTDAADAEAICEAVTRPTMRFVPARTVGQQAAGVELKVRQLLVQQRTQLSNALRGHRAEFGIVAAKGMWKLAELIAVVRDVADERLPAPVREALAEIAGQIEALQVRVAQLDTLLVRRTRMDDTARRLATIPGVGAITASALQAMVPDPRGFRSGRHFAAWLGLTPRSQSSGGKERLVGITKQGNTTLRTLLVIGAAGRLRHARQAPGKDAWVSGLLTRRPFKVAAVALANKTARIVWALLAKGGTYEARAAAGAAKA